MSFLWTCLLLVDAVTSATAPEPVVTDPQSPEQLVESLNYALNNADAVLLLELYWTPAWNSLSEDEVAAARAEAAAEMSYDKVRAARDAGDLPLSVQLIEAEQTGKDIYEMRLHFYFANGDVEEETREAVYRYSCWRLLTDVFDSTRGT
jgi:hypothetical protein